MSDTAKSISPREARLAAALRENLKRRKAQARARAEAETEAKPEAKLNQTADTPEVRESPQSGGE